MSATQTLRLSAILAIVLTVLSVALVAQIRSQPDSMPGEREMQLERMLWRAWVDGQVSPQVVTPEQQARAAVRQFTQRHEEFALAFNRLTQELVAGKNDAKLAAEVEKLWERMVDDPGWPRKRK